MRALALSPTDLLSEVPESFIERGRNYQREGRVLASASRRRGQMDIVTGRVQGSASHVYTVYVELECDADGLPVVDGDCSCPVGFNCKHVVAVLLEVLGDEGGRVPQPDVESNAYGQVSEDDRMLERWAAQLAEAGREAPRAAPPEDAAEHLLYLIDRQEPPASPPGVTVELVTCRMLEPGGYGRPTPFNAARGVEPYPPRFLLPLDSEILRLLGEPSAGVRRGAYELGGELGARLLASMLQTGRCHWRDKDSAALSLGEPRPAACRWRLGEDVRQRLTFEAEPPVTEILPLAPPWYVDLDVLCCGPLETGLLPAVANVAALAPRLDPERAQALPPALANALTESRLPQPIPLAIDELSDAPTPCLRLIGSERDETMYDPDDWPDDWYEPEARRPPRARLSFDYGGIDIPYDPGVAPTTVRRGDRLVRIQRDALLEEELLEDLLVCDLAPQVALFPLSAFAGDGAFELMADPESGNEAEGWLDFLRHEVPRLRKRGWRIEVDDDFDYRLAVPEGWYADVDEHEGRGWFDLDLGVIVEGRRVPLLALLHYWFGQGKTMETLSRLSDDEDLLVQAPGGSWMCLPAGRVRGIVQTLLELCDPDLRLTDGTLTLSASRAAELSDLGRTDAKHEVWHWQGGERLRSLAAKLRDFRGIESRSAPEGFGAELRPYQQYGVGWLQFLRSFGFGGILADDMGLGKTVQTLAHLLTEQRAGRLDRPSLVVAPTSLIANWAFEAQRFAPSLKVLTLHGPDRKIRFAAIADHDLVLTTYPLAHRDREALAVHQYYLLILDEAQAIKNPRAKVTQALRSLEARLRLCLTGTPIENHLGELWSLFQFLEPGLLGEQRQFRRLFRNPIEKQADQGRQEILHRRVAPFMLRRTKGEVLTELPDKTEIERLVELETSQRDLYETIRLAMHDKVQGAIAEQGLQRSQILILDALLKLRQVCCDPRLVKLEAARRVHGSAKLDLLMDLLPEMVEEGRRVLLFSQFTTMLGLIEEALTERGLVYVKLTGRTQDRTTPIQRFQAGEAPIFLISLKAGGTGLNLTAADTVIHYDPWWNPAVETQATDRAHRIGQDRKVFVYKLITAGTVEQKILALQERKRKLSASLFAGTGSGGGSHLVREDLESLFEPLA